jgi:plasmid maintenance system antidote protein VapI
MQSGSDQLRDWIRRRGFATQVEAAEYLGIETSTFSLLVNGKRSPGLNNALDLEKKTGIPVEAWATDGDDSDDDPPAKTDKRSIHR